MALAIEQRQCGEVLVFDLQGRLNLGPEIDTLRERVLGAFKEGNRRILLNLAGIETSDSAGLGELVAIYTSITRSGGLIKLVHPSRKLEDVLRVTKLYKLIEWEADEASAIQSLQSNKTAPTTFMREESAG